MAENLSRIPVDMQKMLDKVLRLFKKVPRIVAVEGKNHFEKSWDDEGFTGKSLEKWPARKEPRKASKKARKRWNDKNEGRQLLVSHAADQRGPHLKDSIQVEVKDNSVTFSTDKPYAEVHNEEGKPDGAKGSSCLKGSSSGRRHNWTRT